jgi:hypothetical protein
MPQSDLSRYRRQCLRTQLRNTRHTPVLDSAFSMRDGKKRACHRGTGTGQAQGAYATAVSQGKGLESGSMLQTAATPSSSQKIGWPPQLFIGLVLTIGQTTSLPKIRVAGEVSQSQKPRSSLRVFSTSSGSCGSATSATSSSNRSSEPSHSSRVLSVWHTDVARPYRGRISRVPKERF